MLFCRDYQTLEEQDRYEDDGLDDEVEDTRDFATIMADRRAADENLDERDGLNHPRVRKLPTMLQEYGTFVSRFLWMSFCCVLGGFDGGGWFHGCVDSGREFIWDEHGLSMIVGGVSKAYGRLQV